MMSTLNTLNIADLSAPAAEYSQNLNENGFATHANTHNHFVPAPTAPPAAPAFMASPSKNPCMVRVVGVQGATNSRYRNDPYTCSVLPPLGSQQVAPQPPTTGLATRRLAPLPPSLHVGGVPSKSQPPTVGAPSYLRGTPSVSNRLKAGIARAQEFAQENVSPDSSVSSVQHSHHQISLLEQHNLHAQSHQAMQIPAAMPTSTTTEEGYPQWAMVRLKHEVLLYNACLPVKEGDFVVLEGDRGENVGRVHSIVDTIPAHPVQCGIIRIADDADIDAVRVQREKEEAAKHFAQGVSDALQLGIRVVDTEFQTDGNKLTIYFTSRRQIDFRRLQRQMFKQYRCRIWLVNWADVVKAQ